MVRLQPLDPRPAREEAATRGASLTPPPPPPPPSPPLLLLLLRPPPPAAISVRASFSSQPEFKFVNPSPGPSPPSPRLSIRKQYEGTILGDVTVFGPVCRPLQDAD